MNSMNNLFLALQADKSLTTKSQVIQSLSEQIADYLKINTIDVSQALLLRESLGNTALNLGIVIPHAVLDYQFRPFVGVMYCAAGISDWRSLDNQPVRIILTMVLPKDITFSHDAVTELKRLFVNLADDSFLQQLAEKNGEQEIIEIITHKLEGK